MSKNLKTLCFGFIGGCINIPVGVENHQVYHQLLKGENFQIKPVLGKYYAYSQLTDRSELLIKKEAPEFLFVFLRHFPYMVLNKPFIKLVDFDKNYSYQVHPFLLDKKIKHWPIEFDEYIEKYGNTPFPKRKYIGLRDVNAVLGKWLGLHKWASIYVNDILVQLNTICLSSTTKLVIIGPPQNPETFMGNKICNYLNEVAKKEMAKHGIDFIEINDAFDCYGNSLFQEDKIHFNKFGHHYLAEKIQQKANELVEVFQDGRPMACR